MTADRILQRKYWNTNGIGIAVVAVLGSNNDIAAYIGASEEGAHHHEAAEEWAMRFGAKLYREEALGMLPNLEAAMTELELHYRS